jgi:ATP-dependent RNA helicase DDX5/DBP2
MAEGRATPCHGMFFPGCHLFVELIFSFKDFLRDFIQVNIGSMELTANHNITQIIEVCSDFEKRTKLIKHLDIISAQNAKVLIFVGTKRVADDITKYLRQDGWPALAIHGDKEQ